MKTLRALRVTGIAVLLLVAGAGAALVVVRAGRGRHNAPVAIRHGFAAIQASAHAWVYAFRGRGVALVDAGPDPEGRAVDALLRALGARREDVTDVLLTHGHADHTAAASLFPRAHIHAGAADVEMIAGRGGRGDLLKALLAAAILPRTPARVTDAIEGLRTMDIAGARVVAYPVPGHTAGSYAYLVEDVLFVGDLVTFEDGRLAPGTAIFDADRALSRVSMKMLVSGLGSVEVSQVCTGHGGCTPAGGGMRLLEQCEGAMNERRSVSARP